jgi:ribosomal protein S18 acetylase RimI-like enzyme
MDVLKSESWPIDQREVQPISPTHQILKKHQFVLQDVYYRDLIPSLDKLQMKDLHDEWFPLKYQEDFYQHIFNNARNINIGAFVKIDGSEYLIGSVSAVVVRNVYQPLNMFVAACIGCLKACLSYTCYICSVGVIDEARKFGIGKELIRKVDNAARSRLKECRTISLHVVTYNESAIKFYQRLGFTIRATERNYYLIFHRPYSAHYMEYSLRSRQIKKIV